MSKSANLEFDFLAASQTQKHLTVNDALAKLDAVSQLCLESIDKSLPITSVDGKCYFVINADPNFSINAGKIAIWINGAYQMVTPKTGWNAFVVDKAHNYFFNGVLWEQQTYMGGSSTAGGYKVLKFDQNLSGALVTTTSAILEKTCVYGVTARVINAITGTGGLASWMLGIEGNYDRYGTGLWLGKNGWSRGLTGTPMVYWANTPLVISPDIGSFTAGTVRIYIHYTELEVPPEVL